MNLPNCQAAIIPPEKLTHYLLCLTHPSGGSKAKFFLGQGFSLQNWHELQCGLQEIAKNDAVIKTEESPFGIRYVIDGQLIRLNSGLFIFARFGLLNMAKWCLIL